MWIGASEFVRNQLLLLEVWKEHFRSLGLTFPTAPVNGLVWILWSLCFAAVIFALSRRFGFWSTAALAWVIGFLMMWLVIGNLGVLPPVLLWGAVPLSMLEALVATFLVRLIARPRAFHSVYAGTEGGRE